MQLLFAAMLTMVVGLILAWKWEGIGGLLILGGFAAFAIVNHGVQLNVVFGPLLAVGLIYLWCGWRRAIITDDHTGPRGNNKEKDMTKKILLVAFAMVILPTMSALAGTIYPMKCTNCGYSSQVQIGGGMRSKQITGFCVDAKKFVYLQWNRGEKKPEPISTIWDSATGEKIELYKCPDCSKPFMPLRAKQTDAEGPGFDHCPKCGKQTFLVDKSKGIIAYD